MEFFEIEQRALDHLSKKDKKLGEVIQKVGVVKRRINQDLFSSIIKIIIGQQISTKAQETVWKRLNEKVDKVNAAYLSELTIEDFQGLGISFRKAGYIKNFVDKVYDGSFDLEGLKNKEDEEVIAELSSLKGIGVWTAEMLMIFSMQRTNILSFGDLAIIRGIRMLYRHKEVSKERFLKYKKRYSPYNSVAGLYLWAIAGGALEELTDPLKQ